VSPDPLSRAARGLGVGVVLVLVSAYTPLPNALARSIAPRAEPRPADAIVVLGSNVNPDGTLNVSSLVRFVEGTRLHRRGLAPLVVFSGTPREAAARAALARDFGVPAEAILTETTAHTTRDEAAAIGALLRAHGARRVLLVTNSQHLARATRLFEQRGFDVVPVRADFVSDATNDPDHRLWLMKSTTQEIVARLYYRLAGHL